MNTSNLALHFPINLTVVATSNKNSSFLSTFTKLQKAIITFDIPTWQTDRRTDMTKLIVTFRNFAKAPHKTVHALCMLDK
jgi:hypothetical protein